MKECHGVKMQVYQSVHWHDSQCNFSICAQMCQLTYKYKWVIRYACTRFTKYGSEFLLKLILLLYASVAISVQLCMCVDQSANVNKCVNQCASVFVSVQTCQLESVYT